MRLGNGSLSAIVGIGLCLGVPVFGTAQTPTLPADFNTSDSIKKTQYSFQNRVFDTVLEQTTNTLDKSQALRFSATMAGPDAGWATVTFAIPETTPTLGLRHGISLQAAGFSNTHNLQLTAVDADGSRWTVCEPLSEQWQTLTVPFSKFKWQSGPASAPQGGHMFVTNSPLKFLEVSMTNRFEGANGMMIDNVKIVTLNPVYQLVTRTTETLTFPIQTPSKLRLEAVDANGEKVNADSELTVEAAKPMAALVPDRVPLRNGVADIDVFVRAPGENILSVSDPLLSEPLTLPMIGITDKLRVNTVIGLENTVAYGQPMKPVRYKVLFDNAGTSKPLSVHFTARDNRGRVVASRNDGASQAATGSLRVMFPSPGLYNVEVQAVMEPVEALPTAQDVNTFSFKHPDAETAHAMCAEDKTVYGDGVTTALCSGSRTVLESLPTTATVVGHDLFPMWIAGPSAYENLQWGCPFGVAGTGLFKLDQEQFQSEGERRVAWHNRLGSRWVREDFERPTIEPWRGAYDWERFDRSTLLYRQNYLKVLGSLTSPALWANGEPPVTNDERSLWSEWVKTMAAHAGAKVMAWEPWPESNTERAWGKYPDPFGYRELMRATWDGLRAAGNEYAPNYQVVGGATVGTDTMFFDSIMTAGFSQYLNIVSFRPMPLRDDLSPERNNLSLVIQTMRKSMARSGLIGTDRKTEQWITSIGWNTGSNGASYKDQARWLTQVYAIALQNNVSKIFWSNLVDDEKQSRGLFTKSWMFKPAAVAYNFFQYQMSQTVPKESSRQGAAILQNFEIQRHSMRWQGQMSVAWTDVPGAVEDVTYVSKAGGFMAYDYLGAEIVPTPVKTETPAGAEHPVKTYRVRVGNDPVFLWDCGLPPKGQSMEPDKRTTETQKADAVIQVGGPEN